MNMPVGFRAYVDTYLAPHALSIVSRIQDPTRPYKGAGGLGKRYVCRAER